jgi:outer membrane receptor protein involved in Fe transport
MNSTKCGSSARYKTMPFRGLKTSLSLMTVAVCIASVGTSAQDVDIFPLEEIVVTAQKREQSLQDVPIAVSAFSGEQLEEAVIKDLFDLKNGVPGLESIQEQNATSSSFRIRGIGTSGQNFGLESAVGMYVDGVYRARQSAMIGEMIDIEAVEVLRGPQGTLFGKNTSAGAIHFRTRGAGHETDGFVSVTAGNYGQLNASAAGSLSLVEDVLAVRGTVFSSDREGLFDVKGFGSEVLNDRAREGTRLQALFTPNDALSVRVIADYSVIDEKCCGVASSNDTLAVAPGQVSTDTIIQDLGATVFTGDNTGSFETALNFVPVSKSRDRGVSAEVEWDLVEGYTLTSLTSYRKFNSFTNGDVDFTDLDLFTKVEDAESTTFSQELRIDYVSDNMNAVVGAYYFQQDLDLDSATSAGQNFNDFLLTREGINEVIPGFNTFWGAEQALRLGNGTLEGASPLMDAYNGGMTASHSAKQEHESWAIFGQFDYRLTDDLTITAGIRYTNEDKRMNAVFSESYAPTPVYSMDDFVTVATAVGTAGFLNSNVDLATAIGYLDAAITASPSAFTAFSHPGWGQYLAATFTPRSDINAKLSDEQVTGSIKLSWLVDEDTMIYVSYGTGYKSGGTNTDRIAQGFNPVFEAETAEAFEVGLKSEFPEQALRINAALHYTTIEDFQTNTFVGTGFLLQNAGALESYGGELEFFWVPAHNTEVSLGYAYTHAEYAELKEGGCWSATPVFTGQPDPSINPDGKSCDRSGDQISLTPEHAANLGIKKNFSLSDGVEAYVYGEYTFISGIIQGNDNDPLKAEKDYGTVNLRTGIDFVESGLTVTLWGRNVLDEEYRGSTFNAPEQNGKLLTAAGEPRTYGLTLNKRF